MFIFALAMGVGQYYGNAWDIIIPIISVAVAILLIVLTATKIKKVIKNFSDLLAKAQEKADAIRAEAWAQVSPLLSLFDDYDTVRLIEKTTPDFDFDREWSVKQESHFKNHYAFNDLIDDHSSVVDTLTGRFSGNPFLFERYHTHHRGAVGVGTCLHCLDRTGNRCVDRHTQTCIVADFLTLFDVVIFLHQRLAGNTDMLGHGDHHNIRLWECQHRHIPGMFVFFRMDSAKERERHIFHLFLKL